jgi:enoyl-CoA hydratase/carnithine racemase
VSGVKYARHRGVNATLHHELARFTRDAESDPDVRVVVLAGAGRAFCAGGDFGVLGAHGAPPPYLSPTVT